MQREKIKQSQTRSECLSIEKQIALLVSTCFDSLNSYGKTPEQLTNTTALFINMFRDKDIEVTRRAFTLYTCENKEMPTPSDILKYYDRVQTNIAKDNNFVAYKQRPRIEDKRGVVQWAFKEWSEFTDSDKQALAAHLASMEGRELENYKKYLINHAGVPREALG